MQSKRVRLRGAVLVSLIVGLLSVPALPAVAAAGASPTLEATAATCDLLGATDIVVRVGGLEQGESYVATVAAASDLTPLASSAVSGAPRTASLVFNDLPNGDSYVVSIANLTRSVSASVTVALPVCDLPTLPGELPTHAEPISGDLAFTGAAPLVPAMAGLAMVQLGVVLLGIALAVAARPAEVAPLSR